MLSAVLYNEHDESMISLNRYNYVESPLCSAGHVPLLDNH